MDAVKEGGGLFRGKILELLGDHWRTVTRGTELADMRRGGDRIGIVHARGVVRSVTGGAIRSLTVTVR